MPADADDDLEGAIKTAFLLLQFHSRGDRIRTLGRLGMMVERVLKEIEDKGERRAQASAFILTLAEHMQLLPPRRQRAARRSGAAPNAG